jgi:hypothetical protein
MEDTVKKTKAPAKARKAPAKKADILTMNSKNGTHSSSAAKPVAHDEVAQLAHRYWAERGCLHGHDVEDWFRAEQELRSKAS